MATNQQKNQEEEVDLGKLFVIIGKGIGKLFSFIGSFFTGIFHYLILLLLFLRKNIIKLAIAGIIGSLLGGYKHFSSPDRYGSDMLVIPNFNSVRQLYNNITYYNELVKQNDSVQLATIFGLNIEEASSLKSFSIEPLKIQNDIVSNYDNLVLRMDTLTIASYSFEDYKSSFTDYDYTFHKIQVQSEDKHVFSKLSNTIISTLIQNDYFKKVKESNLENLSRTDSLLRNDLQKLDSLRMTYIKVLLEEAKKPNSGTSIDLGSSQAESKEITLFKTRTNLNSQLANVVMSQSKNAEVVNVISDFQRTGYKIGGIEKNPIFQGGLLGVLIVLVFLVLVEVNTFLKNYQKNE